MSSTDFIQRPLFSTIKRFISTRKNKNNSTGQRQSLIKVLPLSKKPVTNSIVQNDIPHCKTVIDLRTLKGRELMKKIQSLILSLFPSISPHSLKHEFKLDRVSGAMTNAVYFVTVGSQRMLLRVYGVGCEQILDRDKELAWLSRLCQLNIGPGLLATFENGRIEEYLDSTTLTRHDMRDPATSRQIASRLRQLHSIVDTFPPADNEPLEVWQYIDKWFKSLESEVLTTLIKKNPQWANEIEQSLDLIQLGKDIEACKSILSVSSTITVFAHNDTQYGNILRINETGELVVIDFEYAGYNPRGYDLANHFCEWMYDYHSDEPHKMCIENYPTQQEQLRFMSAYDKENAHELLKEADMWKMACHLFWTLWGLVQASQSEIDFDYFNYSIQRLIAFRQALNKYSD